MTLRIGNGYDVHAFTTGDHVWLCGVKLPHDKALLGQIPLGHLGKPADVAALVTDSAVPWASVYVATAVMTAPPRR